MSATEHRFRTAAFGFNRQDVMQYIEAVHKDYAARIKSVKGELEQERDQRSSLEEQGSLASSEAQAAEKAAQRSKEELEEVRRALLEAQRERDSLQLQLQAAQQDLAVLQLLINNQFLFPHLPLSPLPNSSPISSYFWPLHAAPGAHSSPRRPPGCPQNR